MAKRLNKEQKQRMEEHLLVFKRFVDASGQALGMADLGGRIFYAKE